MNSNVSRRQFLGSVGAAMASMSLSASAKASSKRPNILFCIADDASYPHMGAYGCSWVKTPAFDRVASNGVLFTNCYTPNAKCAPSRSCILTGRNSWQLEEACNHWPYFPLKFKTYPEVLRDNGYHVGVTGKGWAPGRAFTEEGKPRPLVGKRYDKEKLVPPTKYIGKNDYAGNFEDFLNDKPADRPFCFWYGSTEPHRRYEFQSGIKKGNKKPEEVDRVPKFWPDNETVRTDMLDYAFEIEHFDNHLGKMLTMLEERDELDNTIVVVTADNGMPFPRVKGNSYEPSNHLPLAIMWGSQLKRKGRIVDDYVNFIDLAPTFLDVAGVSENESGMESITGQSLTDILYSTKSGIVNRKRDRVLIGKERHDIGRPNDVGYPIRGIVKGDYLFVINYETDRWPSGNPYTGYLNTDGSPTKTVTLDARKNPDTEQYWQLNFGKRPSEELYNIKTDPDCMNNLAPKSRYQKIKKKLRLQLVRELKQQKDPRMFGQGNIFDEYTYSDDVWRGFYEKKQAGDKRVPGWINKTDFDEEAEGL
jgi:N-sulfoglucosamine sulfohydrolase